MFAASSWIQTAFSFMYQGILKDDGYFSAIDPMKRIMVAENTYDLGEYLINLHRSGELKTDFGEVSGRMVYYPPCHLREQNIGRDRMRSC
jgi:glycerol-3-phosphate dehydrogenase subunit C